MTEIQKREIEILNRPRKIKDFWFSMFNHESQLFEKRENDAITTK